VYPGRRPPYRPDALCHEQKIPDLNGARTGGPDGGGNAQGQSGGGGGNGGPSSPLPTLPGLPNLPGTGIIGGAAPAPVPATGAVTGLTATPRAARGAAKPRASVASELASRLNPFRTSARSTNPRAKRPAVRKAKR
jgi:hypothetical protein